MGWSKVPYNEGSWIRTYGSDVGGGEGSNANTGYETLLQPDGPIIIAGDHCTRVVAWQEGAALSALRAVQLLSDKTKAARLAGREGDSARPA